MLRKRNMPSEGKAEKRTIPQKMFFSVICIILFAYSFTFLYPLIWATLAAFKGRIEFFDNNFGLPRQWLFSNFVEAFQKVKMGENTLFHMFFNSLWLTVGGTVIAIITCAMTGYVIAKYKFKLNRFFYVLGLVMMLFPAYGSLPATYKLLYSLGLANTPLILLLYISGFGFNFFIIYGYFKNISSEYMEAGFIDGAGHFRVFSSIMLPQAKPILISLGVLFAIAQWNDYTIPYLYMGNYPTVALGIFRFQNLMVYQINYPLLFAIILLSIMPIIILFATVQRTIMTNMSAGGLKG